MKILLVSFLVFAGFVFEAKAQLCGKYGTSLKIVNESGKPIINPQFKITPLQQKNELGENTFIKDIYAISEYKITFPEGYQVRGEYKVTVSANDYASAEKELEFPHCSRMKYEVVLKLLRSESKSFFRELVQIRGEIWENKKRNGYVDLTATDSDGKIYQTKASEYGIYTLDLPLGKYTLVYKKAGYETLKVENVVIEKFQNISIYNAEIKFLGIGKQSIVVKDFKDLDKSFSL